MVRDTLYRPQDLAPYHGGTVFGPFRSLVHVPLERTERIGTKKNGGGWDVRMASGSGGGSNHL